jgi:hypothetical protein
MKNLNIQKAFWILMPFFVFLMGCNLLYQAPRPVGSAYTTTPTKMETMETMETTPSEQLLSRPTATLQATPSPKKFYPAAFLKKQGSDANGPEKDVYFLYDEETWMEDELYGLGNDSGMLKHRTIDNCLLYLMGYNPHGLGPRGLPTYKNLNGANWGIVHGYLYELPGFITMEVLGLKNPTCQKDAESVLGQIFFREKPLARQTPIPTYTPLPAFVCPLAPPSRLQPGYAMTITDVIFRSSPVRNPDTQIGKLPKWTSVEILAGPVCGEYSGGAYAYWMVSVVGKNQEVLVGWLAEGDHNEYFLEQSDCCP